MWPDLVPYYRAYQTLSAMRGGEMAPQRISPEAVLAHCELQQWPLQDRHNVEFAVALLDREAFELMKSRQKAKREERRRRREEATGRAEPAE